MTMLDTEVDLTINKLGEFIPAMVASKQTQKQTRKTRRREKKRQIDILYICILK